MSDITKCKDEECPLKEKCFRYTSPASEYQSYFSGSPRNKNDDSKICTSFWDNSGKKKVVKK